MKEDVVHLKLEYNEALEGKKDILTSEISVIQLLRVIKKYHILRDQELNKKAEMQRKIKEIRTKLDTLTRLIPKPKLPKSFQKRDENEQGKEEKLSFEKHLNPLEEELKDIQRRLKELE